MANKEHVKKLYEGVEAWNKWREEKPEVRPDLSEENLRAIELPHINFRGANLIGTNLGFTNLYKADLSKPILIMQTLIEPNSTKWIYLGLHLSVLICSGFNSIKLR